MAHPTDDRNFRLPRGVRPRRYAFHLALDLERRSFTGRGAVSISFEGATREVVLHGIGLSVQKAELSAGDRSLAAQVEAKPQSDTLVLTFPAELPGGDAELSIEWTGKFSDGLRGLYMAGNVATTQFEAADARRLFPCFDEPAFKARWALSVEAPQGMAVLSNAPLASDEVKEGRRVVRFAETEVLSSYLVALVCGPLVATEPEDVGGVPCRTWCVEEKKHLAAFAQEVARSSLPRLQEYFGLPYAFTKLDQVGIPDFEAGAMENAGLITYREVALLVDPARSPLSVQKRVAEVVTHELSHQWFGNWVTMVWWDDLWLNEAFATWMAYKIVAAWRPSWRVWLDFDAGKAVALHQDALKSTHPIRGEVHNAGEAGESFDAITYEKGGAVLRMIEGFLGEAPFRDGIRAYMKKHARANAVADDLWGALQAASSQPVIEVANAWIRQSGFPLVTVAVRARKVAVSQQRFYSDPGSSSDETWPVPLLLRYEDASGTHEHRHLLSAREEEISLPGQGAVKWLCANGGSSGFYRVAYGPAALGKLAMNLGALAPAERVSLLADQWALVRAAKGKIGSFLDLTKAFVGEDDYAVLDELVARLAYIERRLVDGEDQEQFRAYVGKLLGPRFEQLGWDAKGGEDDDVRLRRATLLGAVGGTARSPGVISEAIARVNRSLGGDAGALEPNLLDYAVGLAARHGDKEFFEALAARFPNEPDPATKRRYLIALSSFEAAQLAARGQEMYFHGDVPMQDAAGFVSGLMANRTGQDGFWSAMRARWDEVLAKTGGAPMLIRRIIEAMGHLPERRHLEEAKAHLAAHPIDEAKQAIEQTLERLTQDVELKERVAKDIRAWLKKNA